MYRTVRKAKYWFKVFYKKKSSFKTRFHYERGMEHSLFVLLILFYYFPRLNCHKVYAFDNNFYFILVAYAFYFYIYFYPIVCYIFLLFYLRNWCYSTVCLLI